MLGIVCAKALGRRLQLASARQTSIIGAAELMGRSTVTFLSTTDKEHDVTHHDQDQAVDSDRTEGSMKKMGGNLKEGAGNLLGDEKLKTEGQGDQAEGKLQNAWGGIKDKAREITGNDRKA